MQPVLPVTLARSPVRLEPLAAVHETGLAAVIGRTSFHDVVPAFERLEIGCTAGEWPEVKAQLEIPTDAAPQPALNESTHGQEQPEEEQFHRR